MLKYIKLISYSYVYHLLNMNKIKFLLLIFLFCSTFVNSVFALETATPVEMVTPEQNVSVQVQETSQQEEEMFAPIDLDLTDYTYMNKQKNKKFELSATKEGEPAYVKNTGQIWDENMLFRYNFYSDEDNLRVLPSYGSLNSYVSQKLDENTNVMIGQDGISSINGDTVNFAYANSSYYSSGARIDGSTSKFNYSLGAFNETDTLNQELAAIVSTKPAGLMNSTGKFYVGGGVFSNLMDDVNKNTAGIFAQYNNDKLSLGAQLARSQYTKSGYDDANSVHFLTQYKVNDHLSLKNKIVKNFDIDELQGEVGIVYKPLSDTDRLQFELTAANYQSQNVITRQRLKFTTSFKF